MLRAKYLLPLSAVLLGALALALSSCGGKGGGGDDVFGPPFIGAELSSFPPGSVPPGLTSNASVVVEDDSSGASITNATVTMNGVALTYNAANEDYEGNVVVVPGGAVSLSVTVAGKTYTASFTQFTSYPTISAPASGATWDSGVQNTVTWSGGAPTANAEYLLGVLDGVDPNGSVQWPADGFLKELPLSTTSFPIPALNVPAGNRLVIAGISATTAIAGAAPGSVLVVQGFNYVPITVTGFPVTVRSMGAGVFPWNVASSGSQFIAVGNFGAILTSPDGTTWTPRSSGTSGFLIGATWSGTEFVAVGGNGGLTAIILTSPDGITWTSRNSGTANNLVSVASSGATYVAVGNLGTIVTSPDGVTWTLRSSGTSNHLNAVAWSGTRFVAVGDSGTILTSPDGASWMAQTSNTSGSLRGVTWSGTQFVAVGSPGGSSVAIVTSPDGLTWTQRNYDPTASPVAVTWTGAQFVAVGSIGGLTAGSLIITSPDGVTWTRQTSGIANFLTGVASAGTKLVAIGGIGNNSAIFLTSP
jgi:hypothetical protein